LKKYDHLDFILQTHVFVLGTFCLAGLSSLYNIILLAVFPSALALFMVLLSVWKHRAIYKGDIFTLFFGLLSTGFIFLIHCLVN
jgi:hypothetical protein